MFKKIDEKVICITPNLQKNGLENEVSVAISGNGYDFEEKDDFMFLYFIHLPFTTMYPKNGIELGNTTVILTGENLIFPIVALPVVKIGENVIETHVMNSSAIYFLTPPKKTSRTAPIQFSFNNGIYYSQTGFLFYYEDAILIHKLQPSSGFECGDNVVTLTGEHFSIDQPVVCRFGNVIVNSTVLSSQIMECRVPCVQHIGKVVVDVSNNGIDWTEKGLPYTYRPQVEIIDINPRIFPIFGGKKVQILVKNVMMLSKVFCVFGGIPRKADSSVGPIELKDHSIITCVSPPYLDIELQSEEVEPVMEKDMIIPFDLTSDGVLIGRRHIFVEYIIPISFQYHPRFGSFDGNTRIFINFENSRIRSDDELFCKYSFTENGRTYKTMIDQNNSTFSCLTPRISSPSNGSIIHAKFDIVSLNNYFVRGRSFFSFKDDTLDCFSTYSGPEKGGTPVTITASSSGIFLNSAELKCRFDRIVVNAVSNE